MDKKNIDGTTYNFSVSDMLYSSMEIPHNKAGKFSFQHAFAVSKFIGKIIIDGLTGTPQISDKSFFNEVLPSMISSGKFMLTNYEYEYRQKIPLVILKILVVFFALDGTTRGFYVYSWVGFRPIIVSTSTSDILQIINLTHSIVFLDSNELNISSQPNCFMDIYKYPRFEFILLIFMDSHLETDL